MPEQLSIKEFAQRAGVSTQAIYSRLASGNLSSFVQVVQGKKTISDAALPLFSVKQDNQLDCKEVDKTLQDKTIEILQKNIEMLQNQLEEKDKQLQQAHEEKKALLDRLESITEALQTAQRTADHAQALHAGTMKTALIETRTENEESRKGRWKFWQK